MGAKPATATLDHTPVISSTYFTLAHHSGIKITLLNRVMHTAEYLRS